MDYMIKTTQDNNMINHIGVVYIENETEIPCFIGVGAIYDKN